MRRESLPSENIHVMDLFRLDGRVALVVGGAGLYGSAISTALAEAGAMVVIASRNLRRCEELAQALRSAGFQAMAMTLDLAEETSIIALKDRIVAELGKIDILFNSAAGRAVGTAEEQRCKGFAAAGVTMDRMTKELWEEAMRINATGLFLCCQVFARLMAEQGGRSIVNIASIYGLVAPDFSIYGETGMGNPPDYSFAKGGIINFTRYLATYYAKYRIRVNCISPGGYYNGQPEEFVRNYCRRTPLGRMAGWNDIKGAALFLASDASAYVTGHNLVVDGGWTAW